MIWAALATAIMLSSGEGDDFGAIVRMFELTRQELPRAVDDPDRRRQAQLALADAETAMYYNMISARNFTDCLEAADRDYEATREDYDLCGLQYNDSIEEFGRRYTDAEARLAAAMQPAEQAVLERRVRERLRE